MSANVISPISGKKAKKIDALKTATIIKAYQDEVAIDVSAYFKNLNQIEIYECLETGNRFYHPQNLDGNAAFYEELQKFDWYYKEWKWEYANAVQFITDKSNVLDVGCGSGRFLKYLKTNKNCQCLGLEFNDKAIATAMADGIEVKKEFIEEHAKQNQNTYDVVCAFQVLEHIANSGVFLESLMACVKPGGQLIICVPNNNPYYFIYEKLHSLNLPPHHMNMWNKESFQKLGHFYNLKNVAILEEQLSRYRYYSKIRLKYLEQKHTWLKLFHFVNYPLFAAYAYFNRKNIFAGCIMAVYQK